jgi:hypothetical protein
LAQLDVNKFKHVRNPTHAPLPYFEALDSPRGQ